MKMIKFSLLVILFTAHVIISRRAKISNSNKTNGIEVNPAMATEATHAFISKIINPSKLQIEEVKACLDLFFDDSALKMQKHAQKLMRKIVKRVRDVNARFGKADLEQFFAGIDSDRIFFQKNEEKLPCGKVIFENLIPDDQIMEPKLQSIIRNELIGKLGLSIANPVKTNLITHLISMRPSPAPRADFFKALNGHRRKLRKLRR
jgi:hypothetical protein